MKAAGFSETGDAANGGFTGLFMQAAQDAPDVYDSQTQN